VLSSIGPYLHMMYSGLNRSQTLEYRIIAAILYTLTTLDQLRPRTNQNRGGNINLIVTTFTLTKKFE
jgi:hypothetical protein